jgi:hypothetical protein
MLAYVDMCSRMLALIEMHLGNIIGPQVKDGHIKKYVNDFFTRFNVLYSLFSHVPYTILYNLFKTYCMPLYGSQLWNYTSNSVKSFYVAWRKCIRRLTMYKIPQRTHNILLNFICDDVPVDTQLHTRFIKFAYNVINSKNSCVNTCGRLALFGSESDVCDSINYAFNKYGISKFDLLSKRLSYIMSAVNKHVSSHTDQAAFNNASIIRDFLAL